MQANFAPSRAGSRHPSPPLTVLAVVHASLFLASLAVTPALSGGGPFPAPHDPGAGSLHFFSANADAVRWSAFLQFGAAVPLGLFAAVVASRLHFLGVRAAGASIALFGGFAASAFLALSALVQWALASPEVLASDPAVRALHVVALATGGPGHVVPLGLLVAGVAVTTGLPGLLPRWMMASGLVVAVAAELSTLCLVAPAASWLLPLARFPALPWLVVAGALLPRGPADVATRRGAQ